MRVLQVVGYKNSGKTTLIARWVRLLKENDLTVAVLKHHGHGGKPDMPSVTTDTMRFYEAGASASIVAGGGAVQAVWDKELSFSQLVALASFEKPDVVLIEGYKNEHEEKVVLLRQKSDWESLQQLSNIQVVVGSAIESEVIPSIPSREQVLQLDAWFLQWLGKGESNETI